MLELIPKLKADMKLGTLGFYEFLRAKNCPLSGLAEHKALEEGAIPDSSPSKQQIIGEFFHKIMENIGEFNDRTEFKAFSTQIISELNLKYKRYIEFYKWGGLEAWADITAVLKNAIPLIGKKGKFKINKETLIISQNNYFAGRPDFYYFDGTTAYLGDYKSNEIYQNGNIKENYYEQLKFYTMLILETRPDVALVNAKIIPLNGNIFECSFSPGEIAKFSCGYKEDYVSIVHQLQIGNLTKPSKDGCLFCRYKVCCPAFKNFQNQFDQTQSIFCISGVFVEKTVHNDFIEIKVDNHLVNARVTDFPSDKLDKNKTYTITNLRRINSGFAWSIDSRVYEHR